MKEEKVKNLSEIVMEKLLKPTVLAVPQTSAAAQPQQMNK